MDFEQHAFADLYYERKGVCANVQEVGESASIYISPSSPSLLLTEAPLGGGERKRSRGQCVTGDVERPLVGLELGDVLGD